jgi:hypothetical protein
VVRKEGMAALLYLKAYCVTCGNPRTGWVGGVSLFGLKKDGGLTFLTKSSERAVLG